jgi:two-component system, LuxR family, response regulator FixJ
MNKRTVYIVDDNEEFRSSAQWWLCGAGFEVRGFDDPASAIEQISQHQQDEQACVLLDIRMPTMSGLDVHDALTARGVDFPIIYITGHADVPLAVKAMQKGAVSFLEKPFADDALESALANAFDNHIKNDQLNASKAHSIEDNQDELDQLARDYRDRFSRLTPREHQVLDMVVEGRLNKTIADMLNISIKTVELHRSRVMEKLQAKSLTQLIKMVVSGKAL